MPIINRLFPRGCINFLKHRSLKNNFCTAPYKLTEDSVEEIRIPVPWGHVAAKWWGSKTNKPVLCCHGWQDNANTFDTLIPYLPPHYSYLSIDLLGHGLSSHFPKGLFYKTYDAIALLRRIQLYFNWSKFSYIGHSYGAACGFLFSSCFPKSVEFLVAIDSIKPLSRNPEKVIQKGSGIFEKMLYHDNLPAETAPFYTKEELMKRWIKGSENSLTEKSCEILMKRGVEEKNGAFKLTRDVRLKTSLGPCYSQKEILQLANSVACNVLFIKAKESSYYENKEIVLSVLEVLKNKAKYFERHDLPGTHHLHLNNPEVVAPVINSFIKTVENNSGN